METEGMKVSESFWEENVERSRRNYILKQQKKITVIKETGKALLIKADGYYSIDAGSLFYFDLKRQGASEEELHGLKAVGEFETWVPKRSLVSAKEE